MNEEEELTHPSGVVPSGPGVGGGGGSSDQQPVGLVLCLVLDVATDSTFKVTLTRQGTYGPAGVRGRSVGGGHPHSISVQDRSRETLETCRTRVGKHF